MDRILQQSGGMGYFEVLLDGSDHAAVQQIRRFVQLGGTHEHPQSPRLVLALGPS